MGLGKTVQVLSLLVARPMADRASLIVCPASVVPVWREEIAKFFPHLECDVLKAGHDFTCRTDSVLWLASYTQLRKHRSLLDQVEFGYAVLDEGQFIKNPDAKVTQTCFADPQPPPPRPHGDAAREPPARPLEHLPLPAAGAPGIAGFIRDGAARRPRGDDRPAARAAGAVHPAADEEGSGPGAAAQGGDGADLSADRRPALRVRPDLHGGPGPAGRRRQRRDAREVLRLPRPAHAPAPNLLRSGHAAVAARAAVRLGQDQPPDGEAGRDRRERPQGGHLFPVRPPAQPGPLGPGAPVSRNCRATSSPA